SLRSRRADASGPHRFTRFASLTPGGPVGAPPLHEVRFAHAGRTRRGPTPSRGSLRSRRADASGPHRFTRFASLTPGGRVGAPPLHEVRFAHAGRTRRGPTASRGSLRSRRADPSGPHPFTRFAALTPGGRVGAPPLHEVRFAHAGRTRRGPTASRGSLRSRRAD